MADLHEAAAQELLRAIRGDRSQIAFARRLGYRANPITDWENGRRFPTVHETLRAAQLVRLPVSHSFKCFAPIDPPTEDEGLSRWLSELKGSRSIAELATQTKRSRYAVSRWLSGATEPRLPDFLRLLDALSGRLHDWVEALVGVDQVPTLYGRFAQARAARRLAWERPWSEAILRILETEAYLELGKHRDSYIAELLGVAEDEVAALLRELVEARIVGKKRGRFRVMDNLTVDTSSSAAELRAVRKHWAQVGLERLEAQVEESDDWFAYNVIAVSREDSEKIEQRLRAAYREVRGIVAESEPAQVAAVLTMQMVRW